MRWLAVLGLLFGCAPIEPEAQRAVRQPFMGPPQLQGPDGGRLGSALALCRDLFVVAGAPGVGAARLDDVLGTSTSLGPADSYGKAVACDGPSSAQRILSGGQAGLMLFQVVGAGQISITSEPAVALSRSDATNLPVLLGKADGGVRFYHPSTFVPVRPDLPGTDTSFGAALTWFPGTGSARFVVASPAARQVDLYDFLPDAGVLHVLPLINTARPGFGLAVAVGNVSPRTGLEVIVGSEGAVDIYEQNGTLISTLTGTETSFGAALAVEVGWATSLNRLWVGEPSLDRVHSFVGDAGTFDDLDTPGVRFGATLAVDRFGALAIGAPDFPNSANPRGAVFSQQVRVAVTSGEVGECDVGFGCLGTNCRRGTCRGGVFCEGLVSACETGAMCDVGAGADRCLLADGGVVVISLPGRDAGTPDAGSADAGSADAGSPDAGTPDAGTPDAGAADAGTADAGAADAGAPDAGTPDAGAPDSGTADAGPRDAGQRDAGGEKDRDGGSADAGDDETWTFTTRSCSTSAVLPMVLISLALARRRRRTPIIEAPSRAH